MFAKKIDGIWSIALNEQNCGASCVTVLEKWYAYDNGKLFSQRYANLAGYQDLWPELFIDFGQLTETQKQEAMAIWERDIRSGENEEDAILFSNVLFRLPRDGKIITMYIDKEPYTEVGIPESAFKVVSKEIWE